MSTVIQDSEAKANVSVNLKRLLAESRMSQRELSRATKDPVMTINDIVNGRTMPGAGILSRIAEALSVSVEKILSPPAKKSRHSA